MKQCKSRILLVTIHQDYAQFYTYWCEKYVYDETSQTDECYDDNRTERNCLETSHKNWQQEQFNKK